ncbi:MAG: dihydropteroate synthase [Gammaproteobacteria bacterium]|nr:dihydropteroate synthase [Gammaproteobacteria bacterium]
MFDTLRQDDRPLVMGVLNVTPDSFSDGGRYAAIDAARVHAERMVAEGADIIDIGGESTRPGAAPVDAAVQLARVLPIIAALRARLPATVALSIDTRNADVAAAALDAGARIVNDVAAASAPGMLEGVAARGAGLVLMHMQGEPRTMQQAPRYEDVVAEVLEFLLARAAAAEAAGIARTAIAIDPGIGFGKTREHNLRLLAALPLFCASGYAVLLGTSRKRFMGAICAETEPTELVGATCATTALGVAAGVRIVRVHDVKPNRQAADVAWACRPFR